MVYLLVALGALLALYTLIGRADSEIAKERMRKLLWTIGIVALVFFLLRVGFHWIAVAAGAGAALLARGLSLLRYAPMFKKAYSSYRGTNGTNTSNETGEGAAGDPQARARTNGSRPGSAGGMSPQQAREVLGVDADADRDQIMKAYRELMRRVHPDQGGSTFLAKQLNEAKQVLLG